MSAATTTNQYFYSAGKRKTAVARVKLHDGGKGDMVVNGQKAKEYFATALQVENAFAPLALCGRTKDFDIEVTVTGGGKSAQSDAVRHGISRALMLCDPELRTSLKREGFLRRDARVKERKKPGLKRARKSPQWSKR